MKYLLLLVALVSFNTQADLNNGTPLFSWTAPTTNTDGSPLNPSTDLSGYPIVCGGQLVHTAPPTATSWQSVAGDFPPATYDCIFTARSVGGVDSVSVPFPRFTVLPIVLTPAAPTGTDVH